MAAKRTPSARSSAGCALLPGRYYLELQRLGRQFEEAYIASAVALAARHRLPVVATNDVRFIRADEFESHEARVCIHDGALLADPARVRRYTRQQYLRSPAEMAALFADLPEALANSVEIARRCSLELTLGRGAAAAIPGAGGRQHRGVPARGSRSADSPGASARAAGAASSRARSGSRASSTSSARWALPATSSSSPTSSAGRARTACRSVRDAARAPAHSSPTACGITDLDPLEHDLLFERFLNPERVSMPDFDIDFCMDGRDRVIEYVAEKYGRERVSQIITYGTMAAKAVVRDVGRVLGMPYGYVDRIAKLIPFELGITLEEALDEGAGAQAPVSDEDEEVRNLIDLARSLEGLTRNAGMHAGGVVIAPSVLTDFAPLYCDAGRRQRRHAVRQGRRRSGGPRQVRLPGAAHPHRHRPRGAASSTGALPAHASRRSRSARCRWTTRRPMRCSSPAARPRCSSSSRAA